MIRDAEGVQFDLGDLSVMPGLVNAHDHLEFALFPRLGRGPYPNAEAWARDIYHPEESPVREHLQCSERTAAAVGWVAESTRGRHGGQPSQSV